MPPYHAGYGVGTFPTERITMPDEKWHANGSSGPGPGPNGPPIADDEMFAIVIEHMFALYAMAREPDHDALITVDAHYDGDLDMFTLKIGHGEPAAAVLYVEKTARDGGQ